jgi:ribosome maturation factor RimP
MASLFLSLRPGKRKSMSDQAFNATLAQTITDLARPLAGSLNLSLWGIEAAFGGRSVVRVYVESEQGVSIDQCAELSRLLGLALDVEDAVPGAYVLEVSSPGLERIFFTPEQLSGALGQSLEITLAAPSSEFSGRRKFRGILIGAPEAGHAASGAFSLQVENPSRQGEIEGLLSFDFAALKKARRIHSVPEKSLPGKGEKKKSPLGSAGIAAQGNISVAGD